MAGKTKTKKSLFDKFSDRTMKLASLASAIAVLIGTATGLCAWGSSQISNAISTQINDFKKEVESVNLKQEQSVSRVELLLLMEHDPDNTLAIEKMARYYFHELKGDLYMTQKYSEWAKKNGGDISIIVGVH